MQSHLQLSFLQQLLVYMREHRHNLVKFLYLMLEWQPKQLSYLSLFKMLYWYSTQCGSMLNFKIDPDSTNSLRMLCSLKRSLLHDDDDESDKLQMIRRQSHIHCIQMFTQKVSKQITAQSLLVPVQPLSNAKGSKSHGWCKLTMGFDFQNSQTVFRLLRINGQ